MKMKGKLLLALLCILYSMGANAQDSPLVGTWEGTYTVQFPYSDSDEMKSYQTKVVVRINHYDNDYAVRMKTMSVEEPSKVKYWDNLTITSSSPTSLSWNYFSTTSYDCGYVVNGQVVYRADYSYNCNVIYKNGRLSYSDSMHTIYYNSNGSIIGTHDTPTLGKTFLYKEDGNW